MAEEIGKQTRQTPRDDKARAANDGHQERRVGVGSTSNVITKTDRGCDNLGTPTDAPVPFEERSK